MIKEDFVQGVLESYFSNLGYECIHEKYGTDLIATRSIDDKWIIEAKGETSSPRVDFCTCVGQLLGRISEGTCKYGLAVPNTKKYHHQVNQLSTYVRKQLNIYILFVDEHKNIDIISPGDKVPELRELVGED